MLQREESSEISDGLFYKLSSVFPSESNINFRIISSKIATIERILSNHFDINYSWKDILERIQKSPDINLHSFTEFLDALLCHEPLIQKFCLDHLFKFESEDHLGECLNKIKDELIEKSSSEINAHVRSIFKIRQSERLPYFKNHHGEILTGLSLYACMLQYSDSSKNDFGHIAHLCSEILFHNEHREEKIELFKEVIICASENQNEVLGSLHKVFEYCQNSQDQLEVLKIFIQYADTQNEEFSSSFLKVINSSLAGKDSISSIVEDAAEIALAIKKHPKISKQVIDSLFKSIPELALNREKEIRSNGNALPTTGKLLIAIIESLSILPESNEFSLWLFGEKNILNQILKTYGKRPSIKRIKEGLNDLMELLINKENGAFQHYPSQVFGKDEKKFFISCGWRVFRAIRLLTEKGLTTNPGVSNLGDLIKNSIRSFYENIHWIDPESKQKRNPTRVELEAAQGVYFRLMTHILAGKGRNSWTEQGQAEFILAVIAPAVVSDYLHSSNYKKIKLSGIENKFTRYTRALDGLLSECTQDEILNIYIAMTAVAGKRGFPLKFSEILFVDDVDKSGIVSQETKLKRQILFNVILIPLKESIRSSEKKKLEKMSNSLTLLEKLTNFDALTNSYIASYLSMHGMKALEFLEYILSPDSKNKFSQDRKFISFLFQNLKETQAYIPQSEREVFIDIASKVFKESSKQSNEALKTVISVWSSSLAQRIHYTLNRIIDDKKSSLNPNILKASLSLLSLPESDLEWAPILYQVLSEKNIEVSDAIITSYLRSIKLMSPSIRELNSSEIKNEKARELFLLLAELTNDETRSLPTFLESLSQAERKLFLSKDIEIKAKFKTYCFLNTDSLFHFSQVSRERITDASMPYFETKELRRYTLQLKAFDVPKSPETVTAKIRNILDSAFVTYGKLKIFDPLTCDVHQKAFKERLFRTFSDVQYQLFLDLQHKEAFEKLSIFFHEAINDVMDEVKRCEISDDEYVALFPYIGNSFFEYLAARENKKCSKTFKVECVNKLREKIKSGSNTEFEDFLLEHNFDVLVPHIETLLRVMRITPLLYEEMPLHNHVMQWDLSYEDKSELSKRLSQAATRDQPKKDTQSHLSKLQKLYGAGDSSQKPSSHYSVDQQIEVNISPQSMRHAAIQDLFTIAALEGETPSIDILFSYLPLFVTGSTPEIVMRNLNAFCDELLDQKRQSKEYESRIIVNQKKSSLILIDNFIKRIKEEIQKQIKNQINDSFDSEQHENEFVHDQTKELQYWRANSLCIGLESYEIIDSLNANLDRDHRAHTELSMSLNSFLVRNALSESITINTLSEFIRNSHGSSDFFHAFDLLSSCIETIRNNFDEEEWQAPGFQSWSAVNDLYEDLSKSLSSKRMSKEVSIVSIPPHVGALFTKGNNSPTYGVTVEIDGQQRAIAVVSFGIKKNKREPKIFLSNAGKFIIGKNALKSILQLVREVHEQVNSAAN